LPGATDPSGYAVEEVQGIKGYKFAKQFDLVTAGHIHKPQKLAPNVYMLGAPYQQRSSDIDTDMGYWEYHDDGKMIFKPWKEGPRFVYVDDEPSKLKVEAKGNMPVMRFNKTKPTGEVITDLDMSSPKEITKEWLESMGIKRKSSKYKTLMSLV
jgi:DNA repair exonuclease SbcCD nuclease subunit